MTPRPRRTRPALALLCLAQFMVIIDTTIVTVALPAIQADVGFASQAGLQYVISLYALTFGGTLILAGRSADLLGRRRVFTAGLAGFVVASVACALATEPVPLLVARAIQGLASALVSAAALALVTTQFAEGRERARALGAWSAAGGAAGASGLILGGVLTEAFGWPAIFVVNVPIGAFAALATRRLLPADPPRTHAGRLDLPGAATVTAGLGLLIFGCTRAEHDGFAAASTVAAFAVAAALLAAFVAIERRSHAPLVRFQLFLVPGIAAANVVALLLTTVVSSNLFFTTLYVQSVLDFTPLQTGLAFLPNSALVMVGSAVGSRLASRFGTRPVLAAGLAVLAGSALLLTRVSASGTYVTGVLPGFALTGLGLGLAFVAVTIAATRGVDAGDQGLASGLVNTAQQLGFAVGIAAVVAAAGTGGYATGYLVDAALAGSAMLVALATGRRPAR